MNKKKISFCKLIGTISQFINKNDDYVNIFLLFHLRLNSNPLNPLQINFGISPCIELHIETGCKNVIN